MSFMGALRMPTNIITMTNFITNTNTTYLTNEIVYNITQLDKVWYQDFIFWSFIVTCFIAWTGYKAYGVYQKQLHHSRMEIVLDLLIAFQETGNSSIHMHDYSEINKQNHDKKKFIYRLGSNCIRASYVYYHILQKPEEIKYFDSCIKIHIEYYIIKFKELREMKSNAIIKNKELIKYCNEKYINIPIEYMEEQSIKNKE